MNLWLPAGEGWLGCRKGSWRNCKGHWCWPRPLPHWQGTDALHRSHHHGGAEAEHCGAALHPSHDLRENRQVQGLPPWNALEGNPAPSPRGPEVRVQRGFGMVMDNQMSRGCFSLAAPVCCTGWHSSTGWLVNSSLGFRACSCTLVRQILLPFQVAVLADTIVNKGPSQSSCSWRFQRASLNWELRSSTGNYPASFLTVLQLKHK